MWWQPQKRGGDLAVGPSVSDLHRVPIVPLHDRRRRQRWHCWQRIKGMSPADEEEFFDWLALESCSWWREFAIGEFTKNGRDAPLPPKNAFSFVATFPKSNPRERARARLFFQWSSLLGARAPFVRLEPCGISHGLRINYTDPPSILDGKKTREFIPIASS